MSEDVGLLNISRILLVSKGRVVSRLCNRSSTIISLQLFCLRNCRIRQCWNLKTQAKLLIIDLNPYVNMQLLHRRRSAGGVRKGKTKPMLNLKSSSRPFYWRCWDAAFLKNSTERSFQNEVVNGPKHIPPSFGFFTWCYPFKSLYVSVRNRLFQVETILPHFSYQHSTTLLPDMQQ